ncbi:hypothetical protein D8Y20_11335 [Mariprofundus sp. EBB-1]|uniref:replication endonuclease n=1 Tax=Mariprofundus sp. EBB-1 TaxID=2650971 RepID=UPI000EF1D92D|nr:replication endonuclease [Mariprofundus sp. EBB-1]RLL50699.1 hypothetical protein D8Y20_11335 [Mariprofundus sp. EBB-1]
MANKSTTKNTIERHTGHPEPLLGLSGRELQEMALQQAQLGTSLRSQDPSVHLRKLYELKKIQEETESIKFRAVKKWCSLRTLKESLQQKERFDSINLNKFLIADSGDGISMKDVVDESKENFVWEALERGNALNKIREEKNWIAASVTLTCCAFMHHSSRRWNGSTPIEQQEHLQRCWEKFRSALLKHGIVAGEDWLALKGAEPHQDGTVHWQLCIVASKVHMKVISKLLKKYYLYDHHPNEWGAKKRRVKIKVAESGEDANKIANYVAKYALMSHLPEFMHKTEEHIDNARRYAAWRKRWKIRGFSFCGLAPVGLWRECRSRQFDLDNEMDLVKYAQAGDYYAFHNEWKHLGGRSEVKSIHIEYINKYSEKIKKCIGHFIKHSAEVIAVKVRNAVIKTINAAKTLVTLVVNKPSRQEDSIEAVISQKESINDDELPF